MKTIAVLILVALAVAANAHLTDEVKAKMKEYYDQCKAQTGVEEDLIVRGRNNDFAEDDKLKAYYNCMMEKMGFQNADGTFNKESMISHLPASVHNEKGTKMINDCTEKAANSDKNQAAFDCFKCFIEHVGKKIQLFN